MAGIFMYELLSKWSRSGNPLFMMQGDLPMYVFPLNRAIVMGDLVAVVH